MKHIILLLTLLLVVGCVQQAEGQDTAVIEGSADSINVQGENPDNPEELQADEEQNFVNIDFEQSVFKFTGYAVGKSHEGTFADWGAELEVEDGEIVGGTVFFNPDSVNTGIGGLDSHLREADFFSVIDFPRITFEATEIRKNEITGTLTFLGVSKEVTFDAVNDGNSISADFNLDVSPFGMKNTGVNSDVRIEFNIVPQTI